MLTMVSTVVIARELHAMNKMQIKVCLINHEYSCRRMKKKKWHIMYLRRIRQRHRKSTVIKDHPEVR